MERTKTQYQEHVTISSSSPSTGYNIIITKNRLKYHHHQQQQQNNKNRTNTNTITTTTTTTNTTSTATAKHQRGLQTLLEDEISTNKKQVFSTAGGRRAFVLLCDSVYCGPYLTCPWLHPGKSWTGRPSRTVATPAAGNINPNPNTANNTTHAISTTMNEVQQERRSGSRG